MKALAAITLFLSVSTIAWSGNPDLLHTPQRNNCQAYRMASPEFHIKQVIKVNLFQLPILNLSGQYECAFHKNMSAALGASYLLPKTVPDIFYDPTSANGIALPKFKGWSVTPEFRFYPGPKEEHQAPHGFYLAPYFRYAKYGIDGAYNGVKDSSGVARNYDLKAFYAGYTAGLMLGSQWIIGEHFSIDWWILGVGGGRAKFNIEVNSTDGSVYLNSQEQANLQNDIAEQVDGLGRFGNGSVNIETTPTSAKVTVTGLPMTSIRAGLTLGFAF